MTSSATTPPKQGVNFAAKATLIFGLAAFGAGHSLLFVVFAPIALKLGLSPRQVGVIFSVTGLAVMLTTRRWARQSDIWGRKRVFIIGLFGYTLGALLFGLLLEMALAGWLTGGVLFVCLLLSRVFYGAAAAGIQPATVAYIADTSDARSRAKDIALIGVGMSLGTILGPALGGALSRLSLTFPLYGSALIGLVAMFFAMAFLVEPERHVAPKGQAKLKLTDRRVLPYLVFWFCLFMVFVSVQVITAFYLEAKFDYQEADLAGLASIVLVCMAGATIFVQGFILQVFHVPPKYLLRACFPLFGTGLLILAFAETLPQVFLAYATIGLGFGVANPGINANATLSVERHEYGAVAGLLALAPVSGIVIGPIYGAFLYGIQPNLPMLAGAGLMAVVSVAAFFVKTPDVPAP